MDTPSAPRGVQNTCKLTDCVLNGGRPVDTPSTSRRFLRAVCCGLNTCELITVKGCLTFELEYTATDSVYGPNR